MSLILFLFKKV